MLVYYWMLAFIGTIIINYMLIWVMMKFSDMTKTIWNNYSYNFIMQSDNYFNKNIKYVILYDYFNDCTKDNFDAIWIDSNTNYIYLTFDTSKWDKKEIDKYVDNNSFIKKTIINDKEAYKELIKWTFRKCLLNNKWEFSEIFLYN